MDGRAELMGNAHQPAGSFVDERSFRHHPCCKSQPCEREGAATASPLPSLRSAIGTLAPLHPLHLGLTKANQLPPNRRRAVFALARSIMAKAADGSAAAAPAAQITGKGPPTTTLQGHSGARRATTCSPAALELAQLGDEWSRVGASAGRAAPPFRQPPTAAKRLSCGPRTCPSGCSAMPVAVLARPADAASCSNCRSARNTVSTYCSSP